jgi:hypothetical protein
LTVLGDLQQPKNLWLQSLKGKGKNGRVRVKTTILRGKGEAKRGVAGAGGLGGDRGQSRQKTTGEEKEKRHLFGPKSRPFQKRPRKSAVQAGVPEREREKREPRNAW